VGAADVVIKLIADVNTKAFDKMRTTLTKLAKEHKNAARATRGTVQMTKGLGNTLKGAAGVAKHAAGAAGNLGRSLNEVADEAKSAGAAAVKALSGIKDAAVGAAKTVAGVAAGMGGVAKAAAGKAFNVAKKGMMALTAATAVGVHQFADVEKQMMQMGVVSGISQDKVADMTKALLEQSKSSIFSAQETAQAMATIGALGNFGATAAEDIKELTQVSQELAVATGMDDMEKTATTLVGTMRTFSNQNLEAGETAEILMQAANISALSMDDMGTALQFVGGRANQMGVSVEETLGALATMRNMNIDAGVASRSLSQAMGHLISPTEEGAKWMQRLGIEVTDSEGKFKSMEEILGEVESAQSQLTDIFGDSGKEAAVMSEIFGEMGSRAMIPLVASMGDMENGFLGMKEQMENIPTGQLTENFETMQASMSNQMQMLQHGIQGIGMQLGQAFLGPLTEVDEEGNSAMGSLMAIFEDPAIVDAIKTIGTALGDLATTFIPFIVKLVETLMPAIAGIMNFVSALFESDEVMNIINDVLLILNEFIGELMVVMKDLFPVVKELFAALRPFMPLLRIFAKLVLLGVKMLKPWFKILIALMSVFEDFMPLLMQVGKVVLMAIAVPIKVATAIIATLIKVAAGIVGIFNPGLAKKMRGVANEFDNMGDEVLGAMDEIDNFTLDPINQEYEDVDIPTFDEDEAGTAAGGGAGAEAGGTGSGAGAGKGGSTTNIYIDKYEGDDEGLDKFNEQYNDAMLKKGLRAH